MADKTYTLDSGTTKGKFVDIGNSLFAKADVPLVKTASGLYLPFPITDAGYYPAVLQAGSDVVGKVGIDPANNLMQLAGSNIEQTNGADAATKSALVAGKTSAGKGVPIQVDADGKLQVGGITIESLTATTVGIDQTIPGTTNKVVAELSGSTALAGKFVPVDADGDEKFTAGNPASVQLSGNKMELYGASLDDRPDATTVPIGATFTIVDASQEFRSWMSNGTNWGEEI